MKVDVLIYTGHLMGVPSQLAPDIDVVASRVSAAASSILAPLSPKQKKERKANCGI